MSPAHILDMLSNKWAIPNMAVCLGTLLYSSIIQTGKNNTRIYKDKSKALTSSIGLLTILSESNLKKRVNNENPPPIQGDWLQQAQNVEVYR